MSNYRIVVIDAFVFSTKALTYLHSKHQGQGYAHFYCEYLIKVTDKANITITIIYIYIYIYIYI